VLQWNELKKLEEGVLYYDYTVSLNSTDMNDGTLDNVNKRMTNYYIVTGIDDINIENNMDAALYYTKDEVNELMIKLIEAETNMTVEEIVK
jgi:hypothetical protein